MDNHTALGELHLMSEAGGGRETACRWAMDRRKAILDGGELYLTSYSIHP